MGIKLEGRQLELYRAIDEILWREWDPIGVFGIEDARDEYHGYLPEVFRLALAGDRRRIADYLTWAASERMGLNTLPERHLAAADLILGEKARLEVGDRDA
jgi:hypothetical protein